MRRTFVQAAFEWAGRLMRCADEHAVGERLACLCPHAITWTVCCAAGMAFIVHDRVGGIDRTGARNQKCDDTCGGLLTYASVGHVVARQTCAFDQHCCICRPSECAEMGIFEFCKSAWTDYMPVRTQVSENMRYRLPRAEWKRHAGARQTRAVAKRQRKTKNHALMNPSRLSAARVARQCRRPAPFTAAASAPH